MMTPFGPWTNSAVPTWLPSASLSCAVAPVPWARATPALEISNSVPNTVTITNLLKLTIRLLPQSLQQATTARFCRRFQARHLDAGGPDPPRPSIRQLEKHTTGSRRVLENGSGTWSVRVSYPRQPVSINVCLRMPSISPPTTGAERILSTIYTRWRYHDTPPEARSKWGPLIGIPPSSPGSETRFGSR